MWRWLSAEPREVVDLAGPRTLASGGEDPHLGEELRRWRGIVGRRRLVALVRRHAALALTLAVVLEILAQLDIVAQWAVIAVPLVLFVCAVAFFAARGPSPFGLARLLDEKLGLNDRLATALEIEARGGAGNRLEARTVGDAAALLRAGREDWHASPVRAERDWWALAVPIVAIAAVIGVGSLTSSDNSPPHRQTALGPGGGGPGGAANEARRRREREAREKRRGNHAAPTGKLHEFETTKGAEPSSEQVAKSGYRQFPEGKAGKAREAAKSGEEKSGTGKAPTGKLHETQPAKGAPGANEGTKQPSSGRHRKEPEHPTVGFNVEGKKSGGHGRPGASEVSGSGAKKSGPNGKQDESTYSPQESSDKKGIPSGPGKAGGEQGDNSEGHATPINGQTSQGVKIQPGYAPSRSSKGGKEHKRPGTQEGGGGKARTAQVTGATQVGDEFSFVPATGGAAPGAAAGLQQNYTESLKWVERLPW